MERSLHRIVILATKESQKKIIEKAVSVSPMAVTGNQDSHRSACEKTSVLGAVSTNPGPDPAGSAVPDVVQQRTKLHDLLGMIGSQIRRLRRIRFQVIQLTGRTFFGRIDSHRSGETARTE